MKKVLGLVTFFLLTGCTLFPQDSGQKEILGPRACFSAICFSLEIADSEGERMQGLMGRETLDEDAGMLFVFGNETARRKFWMKNTLIPLDMIWLDDGYRIVHIEKDVLPCKADPCPSYGPDDVLSSYVIELNAGKVAELGSEIGDEVSIYKE